MEYTGSVGPKAVVTGKQAVCSSSHPIVTETMVSVMQGGGNAADAAVAGSLVQAVVEPHMTNHAGSAAILYWEASTGKAYHLNGHGTLVPDMAPFRPVPPIGIRFAMPDSNPCAAIPGFIPALGEIHRRFGSKSWADLCQPALEWARNGHPVSSFEYGVLQEELRFYTYFPSGRELFTPNGFLPEVGQIFKTPALAETMRRLSGEGPEYFTRGDWAKHFVAEANRLGWPITLKEMTAIPPRWQEPLRYSHGGNEIIQFGPPERTGVFTAFVLGVLSNFDLKGIGHYTESAQALYLMAHSLRRAHWEVGLLYDPQNFDVPVDIWLSKEFQQLAAEIIWRSQPKIDLTNHICLVSGKPSLAAAGLPTGESGKPHQPGGSCELSIVDAQGNWVQMLNTLQGGGIPGSVVDGVPMVGSHVRTNMTADMSGWFTGGGRSRSIIGSTLVLREGRPWLALGTPGNVYGTMPQVLSNILDYGMDPYEGALQPRMDPLRDDYVLEIESRIPAGVAVGLAKMGIQLQPLPMYDYNMGSFQMCWRDPKTGLMNSCADPRRAGKADGF
jgi:gamma-glutamyltranspeptidase / glutathione hydrolase